MTAPVAIPDLTTRRAPGLGGFNLTVLKLEVRRMLRNRRTLLFTMVTPIVLFLIFGLNKAYADQTDGRGNVSAFIMISMALYGAVLATTSGGAMVAVERVQGWSRQLRITPLSPVAYIVIKVLTAMVLGAASVAAVYIVGALVRKPLMPASLWITTGLSVWIGSLIFAAFGLFIPLNQFPHALQTLAEYTPLYGLNQLVHAPLHGGSVHAAWVANAVVWLVIFAGGAVWRFRKDTARV